MKRKYIKNIFVLILTATALFAQSIKWQETFDVTELPAGWMTIDVDGSGSGLQLVQGVATPDGTDILPHTGQSFWSSDVQNANLAGVIDEWLISPRISVIYSGDSLSIWAGANDQGFDDSLRVLISTTNNNRASFVYRLANFKVDGPAGSWHRYSFDLSAFDSSDIYFAINYYIKDGGPGGQHSDFVWIDHPAISGDPASLNNAPSSADLLKPADQSIISTNTATIDFGWSASKDLDGDDLEYTLSIVNVFPQMHFTIEADTSYSLDWQEVLNTDKRYRWTVKVSDGFSSVAFADTFYFDLGTVTSFEDHINKLPVDMVLYQNYPNPFNPGTTIGFELAKAASVQLTVYDISGRRIITLLNQQLESGYHKVVWDGQDSNGLSVTSGIYIYLIQSENFRQSKKMIYLK